MLILSFASLCLGVAASPSQTQEALDAAYFDYAHDRVPEALGGLADHIRFESARLQELAASDAPEAQALADELEIALVAYDRMAQDLSHDGVRRQWLQGVEIDPTFGSLYARLAWLEDAELARLAPLLDWQIVGPFDNERGRGMVRPTPAEEAPAEAEYAGKVRPVHWRALPSLAPRGGAVRLSDLVDPSQQACVLARTYVWVEEAQSAQLMLGATEEVRVWCQGRPVFEALGEHAFGFDTHAVGLELDAGWNELVLKVGSHEGGLSFQARLVAPETGAPLSLKTQGAAPGEGFPLVLENPGRRIKNPATQVRSGAWARYASDSSPEGAFRRALLEAEAQPLPRSERAGSAAALTALEAQPANLRYRVLAIQTMLELGAAAIEKDDNPYLLAIDVGLEQHGDLPWLLRRRAAFALNLQRAPMMALPWAERALKAAPRSFFVRREYARILAALNLHERANALHRELASDPAMRVWAGRAADYAYLLQGGSPERAAWIEAGVEAGSPMAIRESAERARLRTGEDSAEGILAEYHALKALTPWNVGLRMGAARALHSAGHTVEAQTLLEEAQEICPDRADVQGLLARLHWAQGDQARAVSVLERAVALDFGNEAERRLLEYWKAEKTEDFHEPYREPLAAVLERRAGDAPLSGDDGGFEMLLKRVVIRVHPDGTSQAYHREVLRVLSEAGARRLDRRGVAGHPRDEEIRILQAGVQRMDGSFLDAETGRSDRRGVAMVDFPPLQVGDVVDLEWRHDVVRVGVFGNYFGTLEPLVGEESLYLRESEFVLVAPASFPLYHHDRNFAGEFEEELLEDGSKRLRWHIEQLSPPRQEGWMPPTLERAPQVHASSFESWQDFGRWWWSLIEEEMKPSPEIIAKVQELTEGLETPAERLRAIYDFVVTDIRYNAWEFGVHGYEPYSAAVIFSRGFGDCKDKAILMRVMLDQVDIEAWPVLIRSDQRRFDEDLALPLVEHFNHCIAYVPEQTGLPEMFLDGTARMHPLETLPGSDAGAEVLIVKADGVERRKVPFPDSETNKVREEIRVDLTGDGAPRVSLTRKSQGRFDVQDRYQTAGSDEQRMEWAERFLSGRFGSLVDTPKVQWSDPEDLSKMIETTLEVGVESVSRPSKKGLELPTTFQPLDLLSGLASEQERTSDLLLDVPWSRETVIDYILDEGARPVGLPAPVAIDSPEGSYSRTLESTESGVRITEKFAIHKHRISAEAYSKFREMCRAVDSAQSQSIEVEVKQ